MGTSPKTDCGKSQNRASEKVISSLEMIQMGPTERMVACQPLMGIVYIRGKEMECLRGDHNLVKVSNHSQE